MKLHEMIIGFAAVVLASSAFAQKAELFGDITFTYFNPNVRGAHTPAFNGGGGGFQFNLGKAFGIKGDFQGYASTQVTLNVTSPIPTSSGIIPVGAYKAAANMFTYLFGPVVQFPVKKVRSFGEILLGGANSNLYGNLTRVTIDGGSATASTTQHPFTMAFGGGLDLDLNKHLAVRFAEMDWILTRYTNPFSSTNNQHSFRYLGGVVFKF